MERSGPEPADSRERSLYRLGGVAALIAAVLFLSDFVVMIVWGLPPTSASEWFSLLASDRLVGLLELFFSDLIGVGLVAGLLVSALYLALRRVNRVYVTLAAVLAFVGGGLIFAVNHNYTLIYLSDQFAAATDATRQAQLLVAAESAMATGTQGTGLLVAGLLLEGALVMLCVIMLQGGPFGKAIAYLGLLAHGLDVIHSLIFLIGNPLFGAEALAGIVTIVLATGGVFQLIWYPLVGRRLLQLGRAAQPV